MIEEKVRVSKKGIFKYMFFYIFWVIYALFLMKSSFSEENIVRVDSVLKLESFFTDVTTIVSFAALILFFNYFSLILSRLDGESYLPHSGHLIVSYKRFEESNLFAIISVFVFFIFSLLIIFAGSSPNKLWEAFILFICALMTIILLRLIIVKLNLWQIFLISFGFWGSIMILSFFVTNFKEIILNPIIILFLVVCALGLVYILVNIADFWNKLKSYIFDIVFSESLVAEQSKTDSQNIKLLESLYKNTDQSQSLSFKSLMHSLKRDRRKIFLLNYDIKDEMIFGKQRKSEFLDLRLPEHFNVFYNRLIESYDTDLLKDYEILLNQLRTVYLKNSTHFTVAIMNARSQSIKQRNNNNLLVGIFFLIFTCLIASLSRMISDSYLFIAYIIIFSVFLRLGLRGFEIGRSFYLDIIQTKYPKSFLNGADRIYLAVKSIIEIISLSSCIYLSYLMLDQDWSFEISEIFRIILYAFSVSLFNVSFPDGNNELLFYFTHFIQVLLSIILITIGVSGYQNRGKYPLYFEYIYDNGDLRIIKNTKLNQVISKELIRIDLSSKEINGKNELIHNGIQEAYKNGIIDEDTCFHLISELENIIPLRYPLTEKW